MNDREEMNLFEEDSGPGMEPEDQRCVRLVREFQSGRREAFDLIVSLIYGRLYYTVYKAIRDEYEAEDVVQEILLRIYRGLDALSDPQSFKKWYYTVANTCLRDYISTTQYRVRDVIAQNLDDTEENSGEDSLQWDCSLLFVERNLCILKALEHLPQKLQLMIRYRFYDRFIEKEIGEAMGLSERTVKRHLASARKQLSVILAEIGITDLYS